ncbi:MAG TPA: ABC transporter permease [Gemmatimonadaceae bacterium]|nr:ABC transporter permease [Gemmatimonadaceae bacterium]
MGQPIDRRRSPSWRRYLRFWGNDPGGDLDDELRFHLEARYDEYVASGMSPADARAEVARRFGDLTRVREQCATIDTQWRRERSMRESVSRIGGELRVAARSLRKTPAFTFAAALALALGIGATTAMLSVVRAVLLEPLPYHDADRLVVALHDGRNPVAPANFADWRAQTHSFTDMAAAELWSPSLTGGDDPEQLSGLHVTSNMLPLLGVKPLLGRTFTPAEELPGGEHVVLLSYGLWQRHFAGNPAVVGTTVSMDGNRYTIVGVMPKTFQFAPFWATHAELWAPLVLEPRITSRTGQSLRVFARLKPGVTLTQARADLASVTSRLEREYPGTNQHVELVPLKEKVVGDIRTPLVVLLVAVAFVLLIACANVAHMLLARGAARHREIAIRTALGATRGRLVAQLLTETILLAALGGAAGLGLAIVGVRALVAASPAIIPRVSTVHVDAGVLVIASGITLVTALAFGLMPALRAAQVDLAETFRDGDRASSDGRGRIRMRGALVASEFALALVLLVGAGLMIRSFAALERVDPGFDPRNVVSMVVSTVGTPAADPDRHAAFYVDALTRVQAIPGVVAASYVNHRPLDGDLWGFPFHIEGRPIPKPGASPTATYRVVFPGYFGTMRIPLLRGRDIATTDRAGAPGVVVINEYMARAHWPGQDAIGKRITLDDSTWFTVVGIVKNVVRGDLADPPAEEMYFSFLQQPAYVNGTGASRAMTLVARVACSESPCDAARFAGPIRGAIRSVERAAPISAVTTMGTLMADATAESRFYVALLAAFAIVAVVLAAVGIYAVMSYAVSRRTHEIGIRMALGAEPAAVLRSVVRQGLAVAALGASTGLVAAIALTRLMRGILFGVSPTDAVTLASVTALLFVVAVVASLAPAFRAVRINPLIALRSE